ncbi:MAG: protease complex subunit PrcB family protein [Clostridia bacterium]
MKKTLIFALIISMFLVGCSNDTTPDVDPEFQLIDITEVENEDLTQWYEDNKGELGTYQFESEDKIYLLIAAGEKRTGGYSIELENEMLEGNTFSGELSLNAPSEDEMVTMALTYPTILIEFTGLEELNVDLNVEDLEEEKEVKADLNQVIAIYNGQNDNNSIEVDTSISAQLQPYIEDEQVLSLRITQELFSEIEGIEPGEYIVFNANQDEHDRIVVNEILESKELSKTYILEATYVGRVDNNSIEALVNSTPVAFRYTSEQESEDVGEIETDSKISISYSFNEHGQRVVNEILVLE